jgi:hypothetical protein
LGESPAEGGFKRKEELGLSDVRDPHLNKVLDFNTIHLLQDAITTDIERLGKVRGIGRETECYNVVLLTIVLEFGVNITLIAVKY